MASTKMKGFKKVFNDYEKVELQGFDKKVIQAGIFYFQNRNKIEDICSQSCNGIN